MRGKLTVHKKGYTRKPYTRKAYRRKDGTLVHATKVGSSRVGPSTFKITDQGKPGRTPVSDRWYHPKVKTGWKAGQSATTRRREVLRAHGGDALSSGRAMQALANVQTNPSVKAEARSDAQYFYAMHRKTGK